MIVCMYLLSITIFCPTNELFPNTIENFSKDFKTIIQVGQKLKDPKLNMTFKNLAVWKVKGIQKFCFKIFVIMKMKTDFY